jgi:hypothetical protein
MTATLTGTRTLWFVDNIVRAKPHYLPEYLREARSQADLLIVGLNSDASVRALKGTQRPVNEVQARAAGRRVVAANAVRREERTNRFIKFGGRWR